MSQENVRLPGRVLRWIYTRSRVGILFIAILASFIVGYSMNSGGGGTSSEATVDVTEYTCSMHPQVRMPNPDDRCPICGMELIPVTTDTQPGISTAGLSLTPEAAALIGVEVSPVVRAPASVDVRMVGKVDYDETRLSYITAWVPGRIDRLFVDYTGTPVRRGDHLAEFYSAELLVAQEELIQAIEALGRLPADAAPTATGTQNALLEAAREKLRLWGLLPEQIQAIEDSREASDHTTLYSPLTGIVVEKHAKLGQYLDTGSPVYTLADLSTVWLVLEAYESDLVWLRYGQQVTFTTEAYPGETFNGMISFIDPVVDESRRVVRIRVNAPNPDGRLKPGMFAKAEVHADVAVGGQVIAPELAGKWISPMHPEVIKDGPGPCDVCGMPLVKAEDLGYSAVESDEQPLVIPATAVLLTGKRAIVYVREGTNDQPSFIGREIVLGPRAGDRYIVDSGLEPGELVVTQGNFKIDSALQIRAQPSMMNHEGGKTAAAHDHGQMSGATQETAIQESGNATFTPTDQFTKELELFTEKYYSISEALAGDDAEKTRTAVAAALDMLAPIDADELPESEQDTWGQLSGSMQQALSNMADGDDLDSMRADFMPLSHSMRNVVQRYGAQMATPVYLVHCPMALDFKGADWLSPVPEVANPYFGASMFSCGTVKRTLIEPDPAGGDHDHAH